jgi:glutamate dehydrogenase (NADP+)
MQKQIKEVFEKVKSENPNEPEFLQAVEEVFESISDFVTQNPKYLENGLLERITEPEKVFLFRVPWVDKEGKVQVNKGYRVQFNSAIGPYKGGLRFHPSVNLSILKFLGFEQTFKNALTGLNLGGGKGGSNFDPSGKTDVEIMRFVQSFAIELSKHIGANIDVPAGDIGVGGREIGYLFGQYKRLQDDFAGVLTGKGMNYGGSLVRTEATGYGVVYMLSNVLNHHDESLKDKKVLVSGSGNVALLTIEKLIELGATPLTVSDSKGTLYVKDGITKNLLEEIKNLKFVKRGRLSELKDNSGVEFLDSQNPWNIKTDIAIPCATENEIDVEDAKALVENNVQYVLEGANMPTTIGAYEIFKQNEVVFVPGKAANAGGVAVSGLEMAQNSQRESWGFEEVDTKLKEIMSEIHSQMVESGTSGNKTDYVKGANIAGFRKVADAMMAQGVV